MTVLNVIVLALEGFIERLPISSSARLILIPAVTGWLDRGSMVDAAPHLGTILATGSGVQ